MKTCDEKNKKQEQRGIEGARNDEGNLNLVTNCGFGRLYTSNSVFDGIGSFVFFETKEKGSLFGGYTGLSHEIRFHSIESLDNIINLLTGFRDKWKADQ